MARRPLDSIMARDGVGRMNIGAGVVNERGMLTEGYSKKGGLMGKPSNAERPAPPPAFRPAQQPASPAPPVPTGSNKRS